LDKRVLEELSPQSDVIVIEDGLENYRLLSPLGVIGQTVVESGAGGVSDFPDAERLGNGFGRVQKGDHYRDFSFGGFGS